jgi:dihydrolipoamide dehydrogenase
MTNSKVLDMKEVKNGISVKIEDEKGKTTEKVYDYVLMSIGRKPETKGLGLENTKVTTTDRGWIKVNKQLQTDDPDIYAIGDIAGEPMLAHKASHEGRTAVEAIAGHKVAFEPFAIPAVVFTDPEVAWAGLTEEQAKKDGIKYEVAKFPWAASGRAITLDRNDGVTKLIIDPDTERLLGIGICGPNAGDLISEGVLAIEMGANVTDLKLTIHPHPTLSETIMDAAEVFFGQSSHYYKPKK